jgi:acetate kinase
MMKQDERMKILVANLGSTSFKYRLFDMAGERLLARGGVERIGQPPSRSFVQAGAFKRESEETVLDHAAAVRLCLRQLADPGVTALRSPEELAAIGFKAVHAGAAAASANGELISSHVIPRPEQAVMDAFLK